uniref:HMG box domain-containing protein n=1 Tax=Trichogramma kaykai TaxID=54128 RepID=A0ABD2XHV4_9HYME
MLVIQGRFERWQEISRANDRRKKKDEQSMPASRFLYLHRAIRKKKTGGFENERHRHPPAIGSNDNEENDQPIDLHRSTTSTSIGEKDDDKHELRRRLVHIEPKHQHQHQQQPLDLNINNVGGIKEEKIGGNSDREQSSSPEQGKIVSVNKPKIPRPANAFMLFANEWRKKLAVQNPRESNKDISVR